MEVQDNHFKSFLKAATRVGLEKNAVAKQIKDEIDEEEANAPFPSICNTASDRELFKTHSETKPDSNIVQNARNEHICELDVWRDGSQRQPPSTEEALLERKYFRREQIEALKMNKLREIAARDRKSAMSVLNPVVSLLDGLNLHDTNDRRLIQEVKSKLAHLGKTQMVHRPGRVASPLSFNSASNQKPGSLYAFMPYVPCDKTPMMDVLSNEEVPTMINENGYNIPNVEASCQLFDSLTNLREKIGDLLDSTKARLMKSMRINNFYTIQCHHDTPLRV